MDEEKNEVKFLLRYPDEEQLNRVKTILLRQKKSLNEFIVEAIDNYSEKFLKEYAVLVQKENEELNG